jgi:hypothetical protein
VAGFLVDEAVALGRGAMRREALSRNKPHMRDWGVPVLYDRAPDGRVFYPLSDEEGLARQEAEEYLEGLDLQEIDVLTESSVVVGAVGAQVAPVRQKVRESRGILIGGIFYEESEGLQDIIQEIKKASGVVLGRIVGDPDKAREAVRGFEAWAAERARSMPQPATGTTTPSPAEEGPDRTTLSSSEGSVCPECGRPTKPSYNACAFCGHTLK